ncbi:glycosyltransferase [Rubrivirga sp. IMCC45206]|uniref:glycosyltransferase n=1 Tax=Rubrivirga sp. IMCC45206 TaxID=3391614 RepID=UPI00398FC990
MRILFVSWDGPGTDYMTGLFLPIYNRLQLEEGHEFHVLQFTWDTPERTHKVAETARAMQIRYRAVEAWRRPVYPATAATIANGVREVARYAREHQIDVLMPRSVIPATMCLAARPFLPGTRMVYDADGLAEEERVGVGRMRHGGWQFKLVRAVGERAVRASAAVVTRTEWAREDLAHRAGVSPERLFVVTNGRDPSVYTPGTPERRAALRAEYGIGDDAPLLIYVGSMGGNYRPDLVSGFARYALRQQPDLHVIALTPQSDVLRDAVGEDTYSGRLHITTVGLDEVAAHVAAADLGLGFLADRRATRARSLVKVGEYLLCGTPVAATVAVTEGSGPLAGAGVGTVLDDTAAGLTDEYDRILSWVLEDVIPNREHYRDACRRAGVERFTLAKSAEQYAAALRYAS